jgi:polyisoprenoid-binding protein YceI
MRLTRGKPDLPHRAPTSGPFRRKTTASARALATLSALLFAGGTVEVPAYAASFELARAESEIQILTGRSGLLKFAGHSHRILAEHFGGRIEFDPEHPENTKIELVIEAAGLRVVDEENPEDVPKIQEEMETAVLEADKYHEIKFRSSSVEVTKPATSSDGNDANRSRCSMDVRGILMLHGKSRVIKLPIAITTAETGLILEAETELRQTDYDIDPVSVGLGAVKVKDEVKLAFRLVGKVRAAEETSSGADSVRAVQN